MARDPIIQLLRKNWERLVRLRIARDRLEEIKQEELRYERHFFTA